jgi:hypothetical protein
MNAGSHGASPGAAEPGAVGGDFLNEMRAKLPERDKRILQRLDVLEDVYVDCGRDKVLAEVFGRFMLAYLTNRQDRRKEADIFFVTGPSGAGKSRAVARALRAHPSLQPEQRSFGTVRRYVSVSLTGYVHPRMLAEMIMEAAGARVGKVGRADAWYRLPEVLRTRHVGLVHIDEFNHLMPKEGHEEQIEELANALKGASISPTHPIAFVLSGLPRIIRLPVTDEQVERRNRIVEFPDVELPAERKLVIRILRTMTEAVGIGIGNMPDTDMPERMTHAARSRYARICQGVAAAIEYALYADPDAKELTRGHFVGAYADRSLTRGDTTRNLFAADDWADLPPGSFLGRKEDEEE